MQVPTHVSFLPWINVNKIVWKEFVENKNAIYYFNNNRYNICCRTLSQKDSSMKIPYNILHNESSLSFIFDNIDNFNVKRIMGGIHAIEFTIYYLQHYTSSLTKEHWEILSQNYYAVDLLILNEDKLNWDSLCINCHWKAIKLLENNQDKINWEYLSRNSSAMHLLEKNWGKISWPFLSMNKNAIHILSKNQDKINWKFLSINHNAMDLLKENQDKIDWEVFSNNPSILTYVLNYNILKTNMDIIREELLLKVMHPRRLQRWINMGGNIDDF